MVWGAELMEGRLTSVGRVACSLLVDARSRLSCPHGRTVREEMTKGREMEAGRRYVSILDGARASGVSAIPHMRAELLALASFPALIRCHSRPLLSPAQTRPPRFHSPLSQPMASVGLFCSYHG